MASCRKRLFRFSVFVSCGLAAPAGLACNDPSVGAGPAKPVKSVVPTPRSWSGEGMQESFRTASRLGSLISLPDPLEWFAADGKAPEQSKGFREAEWKQALVRDNKLEVLIQLDPYKSRRGKIPELPRTIAKPSFSDPTLRKAFAAEAIQRVQLYKPPYVCLAMEINAYFEENPDDFDNFVSLFKETRAEIKKIKPETVVFVSFEYEQLLGRFGGQGHLPKHEPHWQLLDRFEPDVDAVGISSYPMESFAPLKFGDPEQLPADYYIRIGEHTRRPIIFAELGWPSDAAFGGSPERQSAFVARLPKLLEGLNVQVVNWFMLYDATGFGPFFQSMGLLDSNGAQKPAFDTWKDLWKESK